MIKMWTRFGPCLAVMAAIYYFSSRTGEDLGTFLPFFRSLFPWMTGFDWGHFVSYFVLAAAYLWAIGGESPNVRAKSVTVLLCLLYGLTDEFHQSFVPGRSPDWKDLRNDGIGALLAVLTISVPAVGRLYRKFYLSINSRV